MNDFKKLKIRDFLDGPIVKTPHFQCRGCGFNSLGNQDPTCCVWHGQKKKKTEMKLSHYGRGVSGEWIHVYIWLSLLAVHLKLSEHY